MNVSEKILNPPSKYDKIKNKEGVCGNKPNLYYNDTVHRIWVKHVYDSIIYGNKSIDEYVNDLYTGDDSEKENMREAVKQAIKYYLEFEEEFEKFHKKKEEKIKESLGEDYQKI